MRRTRRLGTMLTTVSVVAALAPVTGAAGAPSPSRWRMWRITRDGAAARPLAMNVAVTTGAARALAVIVGLRGAGPTRQVRSVRFWEQGGSHPAVYRDGQTLFSTCATPPDCDHSSDSALSFPVDSAGKAVSDDYLVVTWGASAQTTFTTPGWRAREVTATPVRRVTGSAIGAYALAGSVERFTGASAPGGKGGSFALGALPCTYVGVGSGELRTAPATPGAPVALSCVEGSFGSALATRAVRWTLAADAAGATLTAPLTRLLVIDLPR